VFLVSDCLFCIRFSFFCVSIGLLYIFVVVFSDFDFAFSVIVSKFAGKSISRMHRLVGR